MRGAARRLAAVVMAMKPAAAACRSVLVKRPGLLTSAVVSDGSRVEAIVAPPSWETGSVLDHVNSEQFVPFMRAVIATAEEDIGLSNYHLRFCAHGVYERVPPLPWFISQGEGVGRSRLRCA